MSKPRLTKEMVYDLVKRSQAGLDDLYERRRQISTGADLTIFGIAEEQHKLLSNICHYARIALHLEEYNNELFRMIEKILEKK